MSTDSGAELPPESHTENDAAVEESPCSIGPDSPKSEDVCHNESPNFEDNMEEESPESQQEVESPSAAHSDSIVTILQTGQVPSEDEAAILEFISQLEQHRVQCEADGNYMEAMLANKRSKELTKHMSKRKVETVKASQSAERMAVHESQLLEFHQFNAFPVKGRNVMWDAKLEQHEATWAQAAEDLKETHSRRMAEFYDAIAAAEFRPRFSKALLEMRNIEKSHATKRKYREAQKVKAKADALEAVEVEKQVKERQESIKRREKQIKAQQKLYDSLGQMWERMEARALEERITRQRNERLREKEKAKYQLTRKFKNMKNELNTHHSSENARQARLQTLQTKRQNTTTRSKRLTSTAPLPSIPSKKPPPATACLSPRGSPPQQGQRQATELWVGDD